MAGLNIMVKRRSVEIEGVHHKAPIPAGSRIGNLVVSGGIMGIDPETGELADGLAAQAAVMFANVRRFVQAAGGSPENIIKMTLWVRDRADRAAIDPHWTAMFPDPQSRPARHTLVYQLPDRMLVQCEIMAVIG